MTAMTKPPNPFRYFDSSPEVIRLVVMMYVGIVRLGPRQTSHLYFPTSTRVALRHFAKASARSRFRALRLVRCRWVLKVL